MCIILQAKSGVQQMTSEDSGGHWSAPVGVNLGRYNTTSVGPGRGLQLSDQSPTPGRILFIGHHGAYQVRGKAVKAIVSILLFEATAVKLIFKTLGSHYQLVNFVHLQSSQL